MLLIIVYQCFLFSLEISFDVQLTESVPYSFILQVFCFIFYLIDIFLKTNTSFYEYGVCVKDRQKILNHYVKTMLLWDFISFLAFFLSFFAHKDVKIFKVFFFFTYNNVRNLYKKLREQRKIGDLFELVLLLCRLICLAHFIACIWHAIGYYKLRENDQSWLERYASQGLFSRYLISLYWAITTLCTVGYGDITPTNLFEMFYCSCIMLLGTLVFGYSINSVGILINRIDEKGRELTEKMNVIDEFMTKSCLDESLKTKVKKYLQYIWNTEDKVFEKGEEILNKLPVHMREEILLESTGKFLKGFPILNENFSQEIIEKIALNIKPTRYSPCDIIYKVNLIEILMK